MPLVLCMKMTFVFPSFLSYRFLLFPVAISALFPPLGYVDSITAFSCRKQETFHFNSFTLSLIEYAAETLNVIDFPVPLQFDLDSLCCLPFSLFSPLLPPQHFIHLCPRLSFRVPRQGLLRSLSLPKWRRL